MSLPTAFLANELPYKDIRAYLAAFLDECDLYMLQCAISPLFHDDSRGQLALEDAVRHGHERMVKLMLVYYKFSFSPSLLWHAAENGRARMISWLLKHGCPKPRGYILAAHNAGHESTVNIVRELDWNERSLLEHASMCKDKCIDMDELKDTVVKRQRLE